MKIFSYVLIFSSLLIHPLIYSQKKVLNSILSSEKITIDGKIDEKIWETAPIGTDFISYSPENGKAVPTERRTEIQIVYDNDAIYVAAKMYDDKPDQILKQISQRDNSAVADLFGVYLNGYNDSQQDYRFYVSAAGVQTDCISTADGYSDYNWNAVWDSHVEFTDFGWVVEMKIPYATIRFPSNKVQTWGLNIYREIRRERQSYTWSFIDNNINNENVQAGILTGIENINTPIRLFFNPYASYYLTAAETEKAKGEFKGGLDIKYGINDAFTLDVILVPDFGQTKFDNVILNLGPFEQQFNENRSFFTEGTDMFNKGNLLYTRRIGGSPSYYPPLTSNDSVVETIDEYPNNVKLINALKISGRTNKGLGIGIMNAVTAKTTVEITKTTSKTGDDGNDTVTTETRSEVVEPIANYNVLVLDQRIHDNSSVSLVNTNVIRDGEFRDANVSALVFDLNTKKNTFNVDGDFKYSYVNEYGDEKNNQGYDTSLNLSKTSGKFRASIGGQYVSEDYDSNDLGINFITHFHSLYANLSYRILKPTENFNTLSTNFNTYYEFDNRTGKIQGSNISLNLYSTTLRNDYIGFGFNARPTEVYNFYEPRSADDTEYLIEPKNVGGWFSLSTNYNRKFAIDINPAFRFFDQEQRVNYGFVIAPRYRFSDHFTLIYDFDFFRQNNNIGWVDFDEFDNTIFAKRNIITYINSISGKYAINNTMNINLAIRHYWSYTTNKQYYTLQDDGTLMENNLYNEENDINFNTWNLDLSYSWWFAPGSEMTILYRNNSALYENVFYRNFENNFQNAINMDNLNHIFSISIRYHIDYNTFKK